MSGSIVTISLRVRGDGPRRDNVVEIRDYELRRPPRESRRGEPAEMIAMPCASTSKRSEQ